LQSQELILGDCLDVLPKISDKSVDIVLTDPPYGTTACKWDSVIPFSLMWLNLKRIIKDNGCVALFGTEPFSSYLRTSNIKWFKYDWIWHKSKCGSALTAKYKPLTKHEIISIFGKSRIKYFPQFTKGTSYKRVGKISKINNHKFGLKYIDVNNLGTRYPISVIQFQQKWRRQDQVHPTQKPVALLEYLIKTYTNENDTVLDFTMGSGSTGVACKNLNRKFIGIEKDQKYFNIAKDRIEGVLI
jgi:site-specific DNA-methyltransferase (adenine-specific)